MRAWSSVSRLLLVVALAASSLAACAPTPDTAIPESATGGGTEQESAADAPEGDATPVLMLGRSVMRGWFDHWGYDGASPVQRESYRLTYTEIASPPDIAASAAEAIASAEPGSIVFFKLCFVDFEAYSSGDVALRLEENLAYAEEVATAADERDVILILGDALPRVRSETTPELMELHKAYNDRLAALAAGHDDTYLFDLYGRLAKDRVLRAEYAAAPDDSHLNDAAYDMLDEAFFAELDNITYR